MTSRRKLGIASVLLGSILSACGGDSTAPPTTGTIALNVITTGVDIDGDGFAIAVDGGSPQALPANGKLSISVLPGSHTLDISGLAFNCDVDAPEPASVVLAQTTQVDVRASCTPYLSNAIVFMSDRFGFGEVMVMRPDGSRTQRLTSDQAVYANPAVSPDGQTIAVASFVGGSWNGIYLLDRFGKGRTLLVSHYLSGQPAWSPDGTKIAFEGTLSGPQGDYGRIFVVNRDGTGLRQLTPEVAPDYQFDYTASWSPDGTQLVFSRSGVLYFINADGTGVVSSGVRGANPAWSPDGSQIAYESVNAGNDGIWAMDMSFTPRRLTTAIQQDEYPRWSPDGSQLVFERLENNVFHLYKVGADGSGVARVTNGSPDEFEPNWTPNF